MLKKIPYGECLEAVVNRIKEEVAVPVSSINPMNETNPHIWVELLGKREEDTDQMFVDVVSTLIHITIPNIKDKAGILSLIEAVEAALTRKISLTGHYHVLGQKEVALNQLPGPGEEAVLVVEFKIAYGYKIKN